MRSEKRTASGGKGTVTDEGARQTVRSVGNKVFGIGFIRLNKCNDIVDFQLTAFVVVPKVFFPVGITSTIHVSQWGGRGHQQRSLRQELLFGQRAAIAEPDQLLELIHLVSGSDGYRIGF